MFARTRHSRRCAGTAAHRSSPEARASYKSATSIARGGHARDPRRAGPWRPARPRRPARADERTGPDDLAIKIKELREITDWQTPIYVKVGATRVFHDPKLAVHAGADVIVVDGMQGGTAATQWAFIEHVRNFIAKLNHLAEGLTNVSEIRAAGAPSPQDR